MSKIKYLWQSRCSCGGRSSAHHWAYPAQASNLVQASTQAWFWILTSPGNINSSKTNVTCGFTVESWRYFPQWKFSAE